MLEKIVKSPKLLMLLKNVIKKLKNLNKKHNFKFCPLLFSLLSPFLLNLTSYAEDAPDIKWMSTFGGEKNDYYRDVIQSKNGDLVVVGYSTSTDARFNSKGNCDAVIIRYNKDGARKWVKNFGGTANDYFVSVLETSDGDLIVAGYSTSTNAGFSNSGSSDCIIVKYDSDGNHLWTSSFGGTGADYLTQIIELSDGNFLAIGYGNSQVLDYTNNGETDAILIKYDTNGKQIWAKNFGGSGNDYFRAATKLDDGGFVVAGYTDSSDININGEVFTAKSTDALIIKYDKDGNIVKYNTFVGSNGDYFRDIRDTKNGFVVTGYTNSTDANITNNGNTDALVVKYDYNLKELWAKSFGGKSNDYFVSLTQTTDKGIIAIGYSNSTNAGFTNKGSNDAIMIKYDTDGNKLWSQSFGGASSDDFRSIIELNDGSLIVAGYTDSTDVGFLNQGTIDAIIIKYRSNTEANLVSIAQANPTRENISNARVLVNNMQESTEKDTLSLILDSLDYSDTEVEKLSKNVISDMYVSFDNILSVSSSTNSIVFDDFFTVGDYSLNDAINITVSSSLDYNVSAVIKNNITSSKGNVLDKKVINLRANGDTNYKSFSNTTNTLVMFANQAANDNVVHKLDIKLDNSISYVADVYEAQITINVEQI